MKNILITGGLGFIGSNTCIYLLEKKFKIFIIDSLINSSIETLKKIKYLNLQLKNSNKNNLIFIEGDIRDRSIVKKVFQYALKVNSPIDIVIHLAGLKSVEESEKYKKLYWDVNYNGTKNLVEIMEENNCYKLIFSSSATIYGINNSILKEDSLIKPINTYGKTKFAVEKFAEEKFRSNPKLWNIINLRYFNPIGGHSSGILGEVISNKSNNLFPLLCMVANNDREYLEIYGKDWETPDGTPIRDYIHIEDIAKGHLCAIKYLSKQVKGCSSINLGTGKGTSVLELIKIFEKINNKKINFIFSKRRKGDVAQYVTSNCLAKNLLKWEAKLSIERMCEDGWKCYISQKNEVESFKINKLMKK